MDDFDRLCKEFEQLDFFSYGAFLAEKAAKIIPALNKITRNELSGSRIFALFILGAVAADGRLTEEEYAVLYPTFKNFFGDNIDYVRCKKIFEGAPEEVNRLADSVDFMADMLAAFSEELRDDVVIACLMICAIDGKVSAKEKAWIKRLMR